MENNFFDSEAFDRVLSYATTEDEREISYADARIILASNCSDYVLDEYAASIEESSTFIAKTTRLEQGFDVFDLTVTEKKASGESVEIDAISGLSLVFQEAFYGRPAFDGLVAACCGYSMPENPNDIAPHDRLRGIYHWLDENGFYIYGEHTGEHVNDVVRIDPAHVWTSYYCFGVRRCGSIADENAMFRVALYGRYGVRNAEFRYDDATIEKFIDEEDLKEFGGLY